MAFRRWFTVLAVLALMAGLASAQIGSSISGAGTNGPLSCTANAAATPQLRSEGYTELVGDILITCVGGPAYSAGTPIPTTNITVYVTPNVAITSRLFSSSTGASDVLLLIDDPGSSLPTGAAGAYGPHAPQRLCPNLQGGCASYSGVDASGGYEVAVDSAPVGGAANGSLLNAANIYQGALGALGPNTVTFYGVPVLPPVTSGVTRTFRITNIRVPTVGLGNGAGIQVFLSTSPSTVLPVSLASLPVGIVADPGLVTSVSKFQTTFQQCTTYGPTISVNLTYTEGFATSFKTRVVPLPVPPAQAPAYAAEGTNTSPTAGLGQNIPGGLYNGFASNSESGFILPSLVGGSSSQYTAGLADFGTRLKAVFTNIPAGVTLYVSGTNTNPTSPTGAGVIGGSSTQATAVLVATITGEATPDGTNFGASTSSFPLSASYAPVALTPNAAGVAAAVWEVTNVNPAAIDSLVFTVYIGYKTNPGAGITSTNPYGLPQITSILGQPVNNVSMSFAPEPGGGTFTAAAGPLPGTTIPIPRFAIVHPNSGQFVTIVLCQTTLLYPFVTANPSGGLGQGFDTGIAIANTSSDPFTGLLIPTTPGAGTPPETGSCTLYPYGVSISATGTQTAAPPVLKGCDLIANPVPTQNCFPVVASGTVQTVLASQVFPTFQGYVIAVCNFQYAHGYAAVTDLGLRGLFSSYLALELAPSPTFSCSGTTNSSGASAFTCTNSLANPRGIGIENLVH